METNHWLFDNHYSKYCLLHVDVRYKVYQQNIFLIELSTEFWCVYFESKCINIISWRKPIYFVFIKYLHQRMITVSFCCNKRDGWDWYLCPPLVPCLIFCNTSLQSQLKALLVAICLNASNSAGQILGHAHKIFSCISVRGWSNIHVVKFGADHKMYVEIRAKHMATVWHWALLCIATPPFKTKLHKLVLSNWSQLDVD